MKRVLITGGAGMIGRRLAAACRRAGLEVAVFDDLSSGLPMPEGIALAVRGDVLDRLALARACAQFEPEAIVHLAAMHHIPTCERERSRCLDVNVRGTEQVLEAAEQAAVRRVLLASSGAVYAWQEGALDEASPTGASDNYSLGKLCNEQQLRFWTERGAGIGRVARIFNTVAHDDPNGHLLPDLIAQLQGVPGEVATVRLGNLSPRRDYVHADDVAQALLALLGDRRPVPFDVFNVCSGQEHSVEQLVCLLGDLLGHPVEILVDESRRRRVDRPSQRGNPARAADLLGWRASLDLPAILRRVLDDRA